MDFGFGFTPPIITTGIPTHRNTEKTKTTPFAMATPRMDAVDQVDIDDAGVFKYVLIKLWDENHKSEDDFKYLVRGFGWGEYHADIYDDVHRRVSPLGLDTECVGGGRIEHKPNQKYIKVYGYSQGFGRANHKITCDLLKKKYPLYTNIEWSNDGY